MRERGGNENKKEQEKKNAKQNIPAFERTRKGYSQVASTFDPLRSPFVVRYRTRKFK